MKKLLYILGGGVLLASLYFGLSAYLTKQQPQTFGALPQVPALFDTNLANPQGTGDTTMTLASATLKNGSLLNGFKVLNILIFFTL